MHIEQLEIKNYKSLREVKLSNIPKMAVFLGANGVGKSTLLDVFGFLNDALKNNVKTAINNRGGFAQVISRDQTGDIEIKIKFRNETPNLQKQPLITYELAVGLKGGEIVVKRERLQYRRGQHGRPWKFLDFAEGKGSAITNEQDFGKLDNTEEPEREEREDQTLDAPNILAIKGLGQFQRFRAISEFRKLIENWYVANFQIPDAKLSQEIGVAQQLSPTGHNLAQVAEYLHDHHPGIFQEILKKMSKRVPGVEEVEAEKTIDGRIVLKFKDGSFKDPFISRFVSDVTLKMFAYLLLLHDPHPRPLLCVEEPENYLYPDLLGQLAEEFRDYAYRGGQVFITTHSPDFVNHLEPKEVFWLSKKAGQTQVHHASDHEILVSLCKAGDQLGYLWTQDLFPDIDPV
ncbi:MAG: AAA family ATPase [Bacteroidetes bacterium]|jgi:predicted ATPase|nr:AAA family ATPase [Bacteroidota bacterium]